MSDMKDPGFRLFGRNIQIGSLRVDQAARDYNDGYNDNYCGYKCISSCDNSKQGENRAQNEKTSTEEPHNTKQEGRQPKSQNQSYSSITQDTITTSNDKETSSQNSHNKDVSDQASSTNPQHQKPLKKHDKILACPRCNSMTTKFCYFNNYNVHQPRHFCKDCQRYWTAGGTARNVPVGSGRRKNKNSSPVVTQSNGTSMFLDKGGNGVSFPSLPPQVPCILNPVAWQSGGPVSFYIHPTQSSPLSRKHYRDGSMVFDEKRCENERVLRGKTYKVDDPIEAANSSIWTTIGNSSIAKSGFFGGVQQYNGNGLYERSNNPSAKALSMVLGFNPAAFSRSLSFREIAR